LISATDPVSVISAFKDYTTDPNFYQIVYGESILNDAVSIVFYETCLKYSSDSFVTNIFEAILTFLFDIIGSILLGYVIGFLTAIFLKSISGKVKRIEKIEISLMVVLPWVSYLTAQVIIIEKLIRCLD
jgi:NhaP-type Na+/H+ or K+/H+ antiporter